MTDRSAWAIRPHNLPLQPTRLIARAREAAEVRHLLRDRAVRMVTLTGPGGVGKTRLAVAVAAEMTGSGAEFVCFVDLSWLADPRMVVTRIAQELGLHEERQSPHALIRGYLDRHRVLLVLDNFEHLMSGAQQ